MSILLSPFDPTVLAEVLEDYKTTILGLEYLNVYLSTFMAVVLGFIIGLERKSKKRMSGPKTCSLISLASCSFTIMGTMFSGPMADPTRIAAQIVSGIGFLGTAVIISKADGKLGVTSAATVWLTAAVGMSLGMHEYSLSVWLFSLYMFITLFLVRIERTLFPCEEINCSDIIELDENDLF